MQLLAIPTLLAGLVGTANALTFTWLTDFSADFKIGSNLLVEWEPVVQHNDQLVVSMVVYNDTLAYEPPNEIFGTPGFYYNDERAVELGVASLKSGKLTWPIEPIDDNWVGDGFNYTFQVTWDDYETAADASTSPVFHIN
ncbi:hypothetical protein F5Y03DRAFT_146199 [Xylaria venustula]|nr:hypothetical protein F5Y03DRAFT_146199 [Xylaria venustula]